MKQERYTADEYNKLMAVRPGCNKYHNVKTVVDGRVWGSQKEADYYCQLKLLKRQGEIIDFFCQHDFLVHEGYYQDGKWIKPIYYRADFVVIAKVNYISFPEQQPRKTPSVKIEIHETKGKWTQTALDKRKMFEKRYPEYEFKVI